ncbi:translation initiation factor IF-3 [Desulfothermus naphthae]
MASPVKARRNEQIRAPKVRVVDASGKQLGILDTKEALNLAYDQGLDLVEVAPQADPPVCKIMDYGKYVYQQQKKAQEAKKKQVQVQLKEVKLRPKTDEHDLNTKMNHIKRFLNKGDRCKVSIFFRGREVLHKHQGEEMLMNIIKELEDIAKVEQGPKFEGKNMFVIFAPKVAKGTKK